MLLPAAAVAQLHIEMGVGASHSTYTGLDYFNEPEPVAKILPLFKVAVGVEFKKVVAETFIQATTTQSRNSPVLFGGKVGYNFNGLIPSIGYYFNYWNSEITYYNWQAPGFALKYQRMVTEWAGLYVEGTVVKKNYQVTAGIHYQF